MIRALLLGLWLVASLLVASSLFAQQLAIVNVQAPAVNYVFDPSGTISVQDFSAKIWTSGFLQSRTFRGSARAPAKGLYVYEYRVDLQRWNGGLQPAGEITSLTIDIGPNVKLDFDGDRKLDDIFVITKGGMGSIGLVSAVRTGNAVTFTFTTPVSEGASAGKGESSFFFGIVSKHPRKTVIASVANSTGAPLSLKAWAPGY